MRSPNLFILILFSILIGLCFTFNMQTSTQDCLQPKLIQYIKNYTMPTNDLQTLIKQNISSLTLQNIKQKNVTFSNIKCQLLYKGQQNVNRVSPFQYHITNDIFEVKISWVGNVSKLIGHDSFNITADVAAIKVSYTKSYSEQKKKFQITNLTSLFTGDMIVVKNYNPNTPKDAQKTKIQNVIKNDLFNSLNTQLKTLQAWLNDNASKQRLSTLYDGDKYNYNYYGWNLVVGTSQSMVTISGNDIVNGFKGDIDGTTGICPVGQPTPHQQYNMFISMPFIQNFIKTVLDRFPAYKNVQINSTWIRTQSFQFRLIDLEYILDGQYQQYNQYYYKPIAFTCSVKQLVSSYIGQKEGLYVILKWACAGYLWTSNTTSVQILDSSITVSHKLQMSINGQTISVYANVIKIVDAEFNPVGTITVKNEDLAKLYMKQFLNDMRVYVPGTYFKIIKNSKTIKLLNDQQDDKNTGIWIG